MTAQGQSMADLEDTEAIQSTVDQFRSEPFSLQEVLEDTDALPAVLTQNKPIRKHYVKKAPRLSRDGPFGKGWKRFDVHEVDWRVDELVDKIQEYAESAGMSFQQEYQRDLDEGEAYRSGAAFIGYHDDEELPWLYGDIEHREGCIVPPYDTVTIENLSLTVHYTPPEEHADRYGTLSTLLENYDLPTADTSRV